MCVAFGMRDLYEFAFSGGDGFSYAEELDKRSICVFQQILEREIVAHADESPHYKYVHFSVDRHSADEFFSSNRDRFLDFGSTVVFGGDPSTLLAEEVLRKYDDPVVANALSVARLEARKLQPSA